MPSKESTREERREAEVSAIEYVGPHSVRPDLYEIAVTLGAVGKGRPTHLRLQLRAAEATFLAHMLQRNPPQIKVEDHLESDIARLQT